MVCHPYVSGDGPLSFTLLPIMYHRVGENKPVGQKPTIIHLLMGRFRETSGKPEYENDEKELRYYQRRMGMKKVMDNTGTEYFKNSKTVQEEHVRHCYQFSPILLLSPHSNNYMYAGELSGIHNALEILADLHEARHLSDWSIQISTGYQAAILVTFRNQIMKNTIETIFSIKET